MVMTGWISTGVLPPRCAAGAAREASALLTLVMVEGRTCLDARMVGSNWRRLGAVARVRT